MSFVLIPTTPVALKSSSEKKIMRLSQHFLTTIQPKLLQTNLISFQVHAEEISGNNGYVELSFCAKKLDDKVRGAHVCEGNTNTVHDLFDV